VLDSKPAPDRWDSYITLAISSHNVRFLPFLPAGSKTSAQSIQAILSDFALPVR